MSQGWIGQWFTAAVLPPLGCVNWAATQCYIITLCHFVTMCYFGTLLLCYFATLLLCYSEYFFATLQLCRQGCCVNWVGQKDGRGKEWISTSFSITIILRIQQRLHWNEEKKTCKMSLELPWSVFKVSSPIVCLCAVHTLIALYPSFVKYENWQYR